MSELAHDEQWQRLDARMLLVHPIREVLRFLPFVIGLLFAGSATGNGDLPWQLLGVGVPVTLGVLRYVTTSFRIAEGRIELRRGLLNRHLLSTPLDRVRTVDLTSSAIHRVLGLATVRVGTASASQEDRLDLDALQVGRARQLREELLHVAPSADDPTDDPSDDRDVVTPDRAEVVLALDPAWVRFAPLTSSGLVIAAGVLGATSQLMNTLGLWDRIGTGEIVRGTSGLSWWTIVPVGVVALVVLVSLLSVGGYLVANWGFALRHAGGAWHLTRGLLTTRETSLDDERVAGVSVCEPLGLRAAGGGRVAAIVTGLDRRQQGSAVLVPPAPREVVLRVARDVLGSAGPVDAPLTGHGARARRRRFTRALAPAAAVLLAALLLVTVAGAPTWLVPVAALGLPVGLLLAIDRTRGLGHALVDGHLVSRSGSLDRHRHALDTGHVIGWTFRSTWPQRRAGLTTLAATTAGGKQKVSVLDVPADEATRLAADAVPGLVEQFTVCLADRTPATRGGRRR